MKLFIFLLLGLVFILTACRKQNGVDYKKSPYYFYSQDSSKILFDTNRGLASIIYNAVYVDLTRDAVYFLS